MTVSPAARLAPYRSASSGTQLALDCARNVYAAVDRRLPEAVALASWLVQNAAAFGLSDGDLPDVPDQSGRPSRRGVLARDWRKTGTVLTRAWSGMPDPSGAVAPQWIAAIADRLELDVLTSRILALTLHYSLDRRVRRLLNALNECRGSDHGFSRDAGLIALLLGAATADVATHLTAEAKLLSSGLLNLTDRGGLVVREALLSLIRQDIPPKADLHDQLLGAITAEPLPWEAFAHLGQDAEIATSVLRAALAGRQPGVNILLYGPPGTGKTSFAATLAARAGARLRPITEADEFGNEPQREERLAGLRMAQQLATPGETLLLFDEAEDLFS